MFSGKRALKLRLSEKKGGNGNDDSASFWREMKGGSRIRAYIFRIKVSGKIVLAAKRGDVTSFPPCVFPEIESEKFFFLLEQYVKRGTKPYTYARNFPTQRNLQIFANIPKGLREKGGWLECKIKSTPRKKISPRLFKVSLSTPRSSETEKKPF